MRNIKLTIEYDGTNYCGWQVQNRKQKSEVRSQKKSIQGTIEKALRQVLQEKIKVIGSGRTDSGVHALGQVANFKTNSGLNCSNIQKGLNGILPKDIRIKQAKEVSLGFHARFSAQSKLYCYTMVNNSYVSPFLNRYAYLVKCPLDTKRMRQAIKYLIGRHNFRSFQAAGKKEIAAARTIKRLNIIKKRDIIYLNIEANGFLYKMARNIVGTLVEVGRGRFKAEKMKAILRAKDRIYAGPCAPAKGLCLMQVKYNMRIKG